MKSVLMVAYYFPPLSTSGVMRPLGFCRHLPAWGWTPRVLAADPWAVTPPLPIDPELGRRVPATVHVDRIGHVTPMASLVAIRDRVRRGLSGAVDSALPHGATAVRAPRQGRLRAAVDLTLQHALLVPDPQRWWRGPAVRAGAQGSRPDIIYATGGPWTALLTGRALARRFRVPFVADFRDPWLRNPFREFAPLVRARTRRLERLVCRAASRVVVNTVELREQFAADYPRMRDKFIAVSNGFDGGAREDYAQSAHVDEARPQTSKRLELWHFGTVYGKRTPAALLKAVTNLLARGALGRDTIRIRFVGAWELPGDDEASRLAVDLETAGVVVREPQVPHQTCLALMQQAQVLLVIQPDSPLQVPAKIFEYISMRRPLLVVGGYGATASLVDRHQLGRTVPNQVGRIEALLTSVAGGNPLSAPSASGVDQFHYRNLAGELARVLDAAAGV